MVGARAIVAGALGGEMKPVMGGDVLNAAVRQILRAISRLGALDELIDGHSRAFADYSQETEQSLEWTALHARYVALVETCIAEQLEDFECSAEELMWYARRHASGRNENAETERLLRRLLAMGDYASFCALMRTAHESGPMSV